MQHGISLDISIHDLAAAKLRTENIWFRMRSQDRIMDGQRHSKRQRLHQAHTQEVIVLCIVI